MTNLSFDSHAFAGKRAQAVSTSTGIAYDDYRGMHRYRHKPSGERRLPTPDWALDDTLLRPLIVAYVEDRAAVGIGPGTLSERLARANEALRQRRPKLNADLDRLSREYVYTVDPSRKRDLEIDIEGLDTCIRVNDRWAAVLAAIVYLYYRVRLDSVAVGEELGLKPPHVRQVLYRLHQVADRLANGVKPRRAKPTKDVQIPERKPRRKFVALDTIIAARLRSSGMEYRAICELFGRSVYSLRTALKAAGLYVSLARRPGVPGRKRRPGGGRKPKWNLERAIEMRNAGMTFEDMAKEFGLVRVGTFRRSFKKKLALSQQKVHQEHSQSESAE